MFGRCPALREFNDCRVAHTTSLAGELLRSQGALPQYFCHPTTMAGILSSVQLPTEQTKFSHNATIAGLLRFK